MKFFRYLKEFYGKLVLRCYCNIVKSLHVYGRLSLKIVSIVKLSQLSEFFLTGYS